MSPANTTDSAASPRTVESSGYGTPTDIPTNTKEQKMADKRNQFRNKVGESEYRILDYTLNALFWPALKQEAAARNIASILRGEKTTPLSKKNAMIIPAIINAIIIGALVMPLFGIAKAAMAIYKGLGYLDYRCKRKEGTPKHSYANFYSKHAEADDFLPVQVYPEVLNTYFPDGNDSDNGDNTNTQTGSLSYTPMEQSVKEHRVIDTLEDAATRLRNVLQP